MLSNAIVLAAGRSVATAPYSYEVPKGLFTVHGEVLVERVIRQLQQAGVADITVVIGDHKERFLYLEEKFGVKLLISKEFRSQGNVASLALARQALGVGERCTYICDCDCYYKDNPFQTTVEESFHTVTHRLTGSSNLIVAGDAEWVAGVSRARSHEKLAGLRLVGFAALVRSDAQQLRSLLSLFVENAGAEDLKKQWEEFVSDHADELCIRVLPLDSLEEFNSLEEIRRLDAHFMRNVDSAIFENISRALSCPVDAIRDIEPLKGGLTNISFSFRTDAGRYVYRHPGDSSASFINRKAESVAESVARDLAIDRTFVAMSVAEGWKIARFVENTVPFSYDDPGAVRSVVQKLRALHRDPRRTGYLFDAYEEGLRLLALASQKKPYLKGEIAPLAALCRRLHLFYELDEYPSALCHNDPYAVNFLMQPTGELDIIDWEYAGDGDPANDIGSLVCRDRLSEESFEEILRLYFGREPAAYEHRHFYAGLALSGWYWFCWSLAKDAIGDDFGFWYLESFRTARDCVKKALAMYEGRVL